MIKKLLILSGAIITLFFSFQVMSQNYINNRYPLIKKKYIELPLGAITASGWLKEMLIRQKNGATGNLDQLYPEVMGKRNGWLGGDGDQWERGPYWIDGLLPLAYILNDEALIAKAKPWVDSAINSQRPDGNFGPNKDYENEPGLQRSRSLDWWPKMVMLKILRQYYNASNDKRVINLFTKYFKYQLQTLPQKPLGYWSFWAEYRCCDNLDAVYWLYNITGDKFLLELAELINKQGFNFSNFLTNASKLAAFNSIHGVNLAQGIKQPVIYYQQSKNKDHLQAVKKGLENIKQFHGFPTGMYAADESTHGNNPTQGSELCSAVELMYSMERMLEITGDVDFADQLERIAFNALPAQVDEQFMTRQYFQQPNQVMVSRHLRNFDINHEETDNLFGFLTGYPCCTSNMHQGWPKFTQNLFYATEDNGVASLVYAPSAVLLKVDNGIPVNIIQKTSYPFDDKISFTISFIDPNKEATFPFYLRIPKWCRKPVISINGRALQRINKNDNIAVVNRVWSNNDVIELILPMEIKLSEWYERSLAVERGPLVYGLEIKEKKENHSFSSGYEKYGKVYAEVLAQSSWNYGLMEFAIKDINKYFIVQKSNGNSPYPWTQQAAPLKIKTVAKKIPSWQLYNEMAGPQPYGYMIYGSKDMHGQPEETITLIPFGCTRLRISEFPIISNPIN